MLQSTIEPCDCLDEPPLVVDLDGTLLHSDTLLETGLAFVREQPARAYALFGWLAKGKAALKHHLACATELDVATLPYNDAVVQFLESERQRGRRIILATAGHESVARRVAAHLRLFDGVRASNLDCNLSGADKRDALIREYGQGGFDYLGNSCDDLPVWRAARKAYVVNASPSTRKRAQQDANVCGTFAAQPARLGDWLRAMRLHQWIKNVLVFVPLFGAHRFGEPQALAQACLAFICFCFCASSVYILNDLLDLKDDRRHATKRFRPFAAGNLAIPAGFVAAPALLMTAFWIAFWHLPPIFMAGLGLYYATTLAYSLALKRLMVVDVVTLAGLYTLRIVAGGLAIDAPISFWLLALSMFSFCSLAMAKRYAELHRLSGAGDDAPARGRGYFTSDLPMLATLGAASGYIAVMVLALYVNDGRTAQMYRHPQLIWLACPLLLTWMSRVWMLAGRGQMNEDPIIFAVRDRASQIIGALCAVVFLAAA